MCAASRSDRRSGCSGVSAHAAAPRRRRLGSDPRLTQSSGHHTSGPPRAATRPPPLRSWPVCQHPLGDQALRLTVEVLHGVSIDIPDGSFTVLVGPSGCGKSHAAAHGRRAREHQRRRDRRSASSVVNQVPPKERDIAMVFQNYALYPHMTVRDNMAFSLTLAKTDKAMIDERVGQAAGDPRPDAAARPLSAPALGRPAPARGDGPRDRAQAAGVPVRRAAVEPRRQAARGRCAPRSRSCTSG